jgi:hypothetical protein
MRERDSQTLAIGDSGVGCAMGTHKLGPRGQQPARGLPPSLQPAHEPGRGRGPCSLRQSNDFLFVLTCHATAP